MDNTKTKIVATIGPNSAYEEKIEQLILAGASMIRLNSSHEEPPVHKERIEMIRKISEKLGTYTAILLDLQGPKIRVGNLNTPIELVKNEKVFLKPASETDGTFIPVNYESILSDVNPGETIFLDDGKLQLQVIKVDDEKIEALVVQGGLLKSRKGINIPSAQNSLTSVTPRDIDFIKFGAAEEVDYLALSFVRSAEDILVAKEYLAQTGKNIPIIAKIEKPQALENIEEIIDVSDGIMVARGDLGIEISPEKVPIAQKKIIDATNKKGKVVIVATQMLESMIDNPIPTRAEASDVANAIMDSADAIMLSGETAVGDFAVDAVQMMTAIAQNVEHSNLMPMNKLVTAPNNCKDREKDAYAIVRAITNMIQEIEVGAIIAFTKTGYTARLISKAKPCVPIIAISNNIETCRRLNLSWDVIPMHMEIKKEVNEKLMRKLDAKFLEENIIKPGDKVIITGSLPYLATGSTTNFIRIHEVGSYAVEENA